MGRPRKRSEDELRAEARARVEDLPAETATGRLKPGERANREPRPPTRSQPSGGPKTEQTSRPRMRPER